MLFVQICCILLKMGSLYIFKSNVQYILFNVNPHSVIFFLFPTTMLTESFALKISNFLGSFSAAKERYILVGPD